MSYVDFEPRFLNPMVTSLMEKHRNRRAVAGQKNKKITNAVRRSSGLFDCLDVLSRNYG